MRLTRVTKVQLLAFVAISMSALSLIAVNYMKVPEMLGAGRYFVTVVMPDATGVHPSTLVTLRGSPIGSVSDIAVRPGEVRVRLALDSDVAVPATSRVFVRSASAAGEQYIDLVPRSSRPPFLASSDVLTSDRVTPLQSTGDLVDGATRLAASIDPADVETVLRELSTGLEGSSEEWRSLFTSTRTITGQLDANVHEMTGLIDGLSAFLKTQRKTLPDFESSARHLDPWTEAVRGSKSDIRDILEEGADTLDTASAILRENAGDLELLLTDLSSTGQVLKVYLPGLEQILVIYPAVISSLIGATTESGGAEPGSVHLGFRPNVEQPPHCTEGYLPLKDQRDYHDYTTRLPLRQDLYCQVPHDDPRTVRGAHNMPCYNAPGRRAGSVEECLGRKIGSITNPLSPDSQSAAGTYRPDTKRATTADGQTFMLGQSFDGAKGAQEWSSYLQP